MADRASRGREAGPSGALNPRAMVRIGFDGLLGYEIDRFDDVEVRGHVALRDDLTQPYGIVHGGVYAAIAESAASLGTLCGVLPEGQVALGLSNQTSFLRPIDQGTVHVVARRRHRGRTTWMWDVEFSDDAGRLCATSQVRLAVRPAPADMEVRGLVEEPPAPDTGQPR